MTENLPVSSSLPYLVALLAGLLLAAVLSGLMVRRLRLQVMRQAHALRLLAALGRYAVWPAALRAPLGEDLPDAPSRAALADVQALQGRHFPQVEPCMARLRQADAALRDFLHAQRSLKLSDAEAWLLSQHETRLDTLCQRVQSAIEALTHAVREAREPAHRIMVK